MFTKRKKKKTSQERPNDRVYDDADFLQWIDETKEAAFLGAEVFERYFTLGGEKMLCRIGLYWTDKADQEPRIGKIECVPAWIKEREGK